MYIDWGTTLIAIGVLFLNNAAPIAPALRFNGDPSSQLTNCTFRGHGSSAIVITTPLSWICPLGTFMPSTGTFPDFDQRVGCVFECAAGSYGHLPTLTAADQCAVCPIGHYCEAGTATPIACPAGTYLPNVPGQRSGYSRQSCLRARTHALRTAALQRRWCPVPPFTIRAAPWQHAFLAHIQAARASPSTWTPTLEAARARRVVSGRTAPHSRPQTAPNARRAGALLLQRVDVPLLLPVLSSSEQS